MLPCLLIQQVTVTTLPPEHILNLLSLWAHTHTAFFLCSFLLSDSWPGKESKVFSLWPPGPGALWHNDVGPLVLTAFSHNTWIFSIWTVAGNTVHFRAKGIRVTRIASYAQRAHHVLGTLSSLHRWEIETLKCSILSIICSVE